MSIGEVVLAFVLVLRVGAFFSGVGLAVSYGITLFYLFKDLSDDKIDFDDAWFFIAISIYGVTFSVMMVLCALRFGAFFSHFESFYSWITRGLFYIFCGILSLGLSTSLNAISLSRFFDGDQEFVKFQEAISYIAIAVGVVYIGMSLLCCKGRGESENRKRRIL
eukprot:snap_masked-scaffold_1-processed-gene-1.1-mRNA-1 protein AED:0.37 eAED:1.00 QI:0/-1/0/1/-1/1/1/0/163